MHTGNDRSVPRRGAATLEDAGGTADEGLYRRGAKEIYFLFLYFARDAHFRRTTKESEINEYSGAAERAVRLGTGWREMS